MLYPQRGMNWHLLTGWGRATLAVSIFLPIPRPQISRLWAFFVLAVRNYLPHPLRRLEGKFGAFLAMSVRGGRCKCGGLAVRGSFCLCCSMLYDIITTYNSR